MLGGRRASIRELARRVSQAGGGAAAAAAVATASFNAGHPAGPAAAAAGDPDAHHRDNTLDGHMRQYASALRLIGGQAGAGGSGGAAH